MQVIFDIKCNSWARLDSFSKQARAMCILIIRLGVDATIRTRDTSENKG